MEVLFAQPISTKSSLEIENDLPYLRLSAESEQYRGYFLTLLCPTNAEHIFPDFRTVDDSQTSVIEVGNDHVVFNKTGANVTYNNLQTDGEIFIKRGDQELEFAAVFKATFLTYKDVKYISTDWVTNIVFSVSKDRFRIFIGNQSVMVLIGVQ